MIWISVKDQPVPKDGSYIAIDKDGNIAIICFEQVRQGDNGWYIKSHNDYFSFDATHWMELPEC